MDEVGSAEEEENFTSEEVFERFELCELGFEHALVLVMMREEGACEDESGKRASDIIQEGHSAVE